jgi:serine/threonine protein kinase
LYLPFTLCIYSPHHQDFIQRLLEFDPAQRPSSEDAIQHRWFRHVRELELEFASARGLDFSRKDFSRKGEGKPGEDESGEQNKRNAAIDGAVDASVSALGLDNDGSSNSNNDGSGDGVRVVESLLEFKSFSRLKQTALGE